MIDNGDGTVSFRDVTEYTNVQDSNILAQVLNTANDAINRMMNGEIFYTEAEVDALLALKQNLLTFDNAPTAGSNNPVKSSGIKTALDTINTRIDNLNVFSFHICTSGEYDPVTGQPTIQNPDTSTFYLVPTGSSPDVFTEWVYINNAWEKFGSTTVDLSNYVTTSDLQDALDDKQDVLTFDNTPTENSDNPVTSDGIYDALFGKSDTGHNHDDRYYTEAETDSLLSGKSDTGHNHDGRYYTEAEVDTLLGGKRDISSSYSSAEVDTLLSAKVDNTSIGTMAAEDDAPSDGEEYVRKNGDWAIPSGGTGTVAWGDIDGTLSDQTDLQSALNAKADNADLGDLAGKDTVDWDTDIDNIPAAFPPEAHNHDDRYYTESEVDGLLADKADTSNLGNLAYEDAIDYSDVQNTPTLGDLAGKDTVDWDTDIDNIPAAFPPSSHNHDGRYYTESEVDTALSGKVSKAGDTMTGVLDINTNIRVHDLGMTYGTAPASDIWGHPIQLCDKANNSCAYIRGIYRSSGMNQLNLSAINTGVENYIRLNANLDGTQTVNISAAPSWRSALGLGPLATVTDTGWVSIAGSSSNGMANGSTIYYRVIGYFVQVVCYQIYLRANLTSTYVNLVTNGLSSYKPKAHTYIPALDTAGAYAYILSDSGTIRFYKGNNSSWATTKAITFNMMYIRA